MNESKSSRYHRLKRQAGLCSLAVTAGILGAAVWARPQGPPALLVVMLATACELAALPIAYYASFVLDHRYELSTESAGAWFRDHLKFFLISLCLAALGAEAVYALIAWSPQWWWVMAAAGVTLFSMLLARLAPILLLPLFYDFTPLQRPALQARLAELSKRAGVPVLGVFEWGLGTRSRRANAALVGSGTTRRILLSDTLLAEYTDDEIEVILAHEIAHHVHRDIRNGIALEFLLFLGAGYAAAVALAASWPRLGLTSAADPAGLPVLVLVGGAVMLAATPLVNAWSRANERRADDFAVALTRRGDAFASAIRRLGAQNLAEENPSRASVVLFHTHPPIEERITAALSALAAPVSAEDVRSS